MTFKKLSAGAIAALATLALAACGGDAEAGAYERPEDIRDALSSTDYECTHWEVRSGEEESGNCQPFGMGSNWATITDDPDGLIDTVYDLDTNGVQMIRGDGWTFQCSHIIAEGTERGGCAEVADILGGEIA